MPTIEDVAKQPLEQRLARMARTAAELGDAIDGRSEAVLVRRPDLKNWAAKEIICHLRDTEELFLGRLEMIAAMDAKGCKTAIFERLDRVARKLTTQEGIIARFQLSGYVLIRVCNVNRDTS